MSVFGCLGACLRLSQVQLDLFQLLIEGEGGREGGCVKWEKRTHVKSSVIILSVSSDSYHRPLQGGRQTVSIEEMWSLEPV